MNDAELDAAGITGPLDRDAYRRASALLRRQARARGSGTAIRFMFPPSTRPYFEVLFAFITYVDDIVDLREHSVEIRERRLAEWEAAFSAAVKDETPAVSASRDEESDRAVARAFVHLMRRWELPLDEVPRWVQGQRDTLTTTEYRTREDLRRFIDTVTLMPAVWANRLLGNESAEAAELCGHATTSFQMIDFLWDLREDLELGCLYLPLDAVAAAGLGRAELEAGVRGGRLGPAVRDLLAAEVRRVRESFDTARPWPRLLPVSSRTFIEWEFALNELRLLALEQDPVAHLAPGFRTPVSFKARALGRTYRDIAGAALRRKGFPW
ncbi:squalene/phytoene synthase family protein [Amycolatopsis sp. 195334CR]|uniref:phytoene/squalene synthase family protein n=1 Tax=Amycolatopsis sp. 195334CR TaxID=2814588 RepID=UPI001A8D1300|nr:squalene/phytoene synthase family protein [Amycolatopsis sp. 195334CR]MBN6040608.1 squalene/phytoene synthase family protein [Amycolatopsis sp. 195334CR]